MLQYFCLLFDPIAYYHISEVRYAWTYSIFLEYLGGKEDFPLDILAIIVNQSRRKYRSDLPEDIQYLINYQMINLLNVL